MSHIPKSFYGAKRLGPNKVKSLFNYDFLDFLKICFRYHFGLGKGKNQHIKKMNDCDECNPPTKKQRFDVKKRTNTARNESAVMKIRKLKIINSFKREYVASSATAKAQYVVSICNALTCIFRDFHINGERE